SHSVPHFDFPADCFLSDRRGRADDTTARYGCRFFSGLRRSSPNIRPRGQRREVGCVSRCGCTFHYFGNTFYGLLVLLLVLWWRLGPKYRDWAERASKRRFVQVLIFAPLLLLTVSVLNLPTSIWDQSIELKFGRSVQRWGSWFSDWITSQIILLIVGTLVVWLLYGVIRRSPRRWWFYFWLASIPIISILLFLQPLIIDPLFFKFKPLAGSHPDLVLEVEQVVHHGGMDIPRERMFEMNASTKTTEMNAYVAGFGASKRAVMWDTILTKATPQEALFVFGHEMGHYVLLHIPQLIGWISLLLLVLLYIAYRVVGGILMRWGPTWQIRSIDDWASLPLLLLLLAVLTFLATPVLNAISRHYEHEADRYGIEVIHGIVPNANQVAAHYFEKSGEINLNDPAPSEWVKIWFYDHPTRPERVHFVATYDPWSQGEKGKYVP
ncbi:MAG TPA: M48 family metalloprotease, partial [Terriglobales bacterium]